MAHSCVECGWSTEGDPEQDYCPQCGRCVLFLPSKEEIIQATRAIQATWSEVEEDRRRAGAYRNGRVQWMPQADVQF